MAGDDDLQLGPSQRAVFEAIRDADGWVRRGEIVEKVDRMGQGAVTNSLDKLKARGLVETKRSDLNRTWKVYTVSEDDQ